MDQCPVLEKARTLHHLGMVARYLGAFGVSNEHLLKALAITQAAEKVCDQILCSFVVSRFCSRVYHQVTDAVRGHRTPYRLDWLHF
jgi:hypothetical protein